MGVGLAESIWSGTDFVAAEVKTSRLVDPWSPAKLPSRPEVSLSSDVGDLPEHPDFDPESHAELPRPDAAAIKELHPTIAIFDFWNASPETLADMPRVVNALDWGWADLPHFDPDKSVNPFVISSRLDSVEEIASKRARWLLNLLGVGALRRQSFMRFFAEIFDNYPTRQTFTALTNLVEEGISVDTLRTACEFRIHFLAEAKWRLVRSGSKRSTAQPAFSDGIMGWARAARWVNLCKGDDPSVYLDDAWVEDWHDLPQNSPDRWAFVDYAEQRLAMIGEGVLEIDFDSSMRWVPSEFRQNYLPTGSQMLSRLGQLALPATGMLRQERSSK